MITFLGDRAGALRLLLGCRRLLACALALLVLGLPSPASAQLGAAGYGGVYGYNYSPTTVVVPDYSLLRVGEQFYPPSLLGVRELCAAQPQLCEAPDLQAELGRLQRYKHVSDALLVGGVTAVAAGVGVLLWSLSDRFNGQTKPIVAGSLFGGGLVGSLVGSILRPDRDDVRGLVNSINRSHHDTPVQWGLILAPWGRGMAGSLAAAF